MIEQPTVFVLGAGAGVPYGFPTARDLRRKIIENFVSDIPGLCPRAYGQERIFVDAAEEFIRTFEESKTESVDLFLKRNPRFAEIGKPAIVHYILWYEREGKLFENMEEPNLDWFSYLYNKRMANTLKDPEGYEHFGDNKVTFVTFNYDRSLEELLFKSLKNSFTEASEREVIDQLLKVPVLHVYGKVGDFRALGKGVVYGTEEPLSTIKVFARNIRIIDEGPPNRQAEKELLDAINAIQQGKRIFFLGFGYAEENLEVLQFHDIVDQSKQIFGTAVGLEDAEVARIRARLKRGFSGPARTNSSYVNPRIEKGMDCVKLLKNYL